VKLLATHRRLRAALRGDVPASLYERGGRALDAVTWSELEAENQWDVAADLAPLVASEPAFRRLVDQRGCRAERLLRKMLSEWASPPDLTVAPAERDEEWDQRVNWLIAGSRPDYPLPAATPEDDAVAPYRAVLTASRALTAHWLEANGIDRLVLFRGEVCDGRSPRLEHVEHESVTLSSWTPALGTALVFAGLRGLGTAGLAGHGRILAALVEAKYVAATARTGIGSVVADEIILDGGRTPVIALTAPIEGFGHALSEAIHAVAEGRTFPTPLERLEVEFIERLDKRDHALIDRQTACPGLTRRGASLETNVEINNYAEREPAGPRARRRNPR
jgi:hypothetical protein